MNLDDMMCCSVPSVSHMSCSPSRTSTSDLDTEFKDFCLSGFAFPTPAFLNEFWQQTGYHSATRCQSFMHHRVHRWCFLLWFAVCSREHPLLRQENPPTEIVARKERHLVGHGIFRTLISSNYLVVILQRSCRF